MTEQSEELSNFDLFVIALSIFSLINIVWLIAPLSEPITTVVLIVDVVFSIAFLGDFFLRLFRAPTKSFYFFNQRGWLDLLGSLPFPYIRILRIVRMVRVYQPIRTLGPRGVWKRLRVDLAGSALLVAVFLTIIVIQYASMGILWVEGDKPDANIRTGSDAIWWSYVTVTTVGYGDRFPVTSAGRLVGVALLTVGIGLFGVLTGYLANSFLKPKRPDGDEVRQAALDARLRELETLIERLRPAATSESATPDGGVATGNSPVGNEETS
jgi:voltage-gated potassium channel